MTTSTPVRRGRPPALSRAVVEDLAFELVREHGYDSSSMRELAAQLGVSAMAVQRITGGRDALDHALVNRLIESERCATWPTEWRDAVREYARLIRRVFAFHPAILAAMSRRHLDSPYALEVDDRTLAPLIEAGLPPLAAAQVVLAVRNYVTGHVSVQLNRRENDVVDLADYPHLAAARAALISTNENELFEQGIELLLDGVASRLS